MKKLVILFFFLLTLALPVTSFAVNGWTIQYGSISANYWGPVASSSDGTKLAAAIAGYYIYTSNDSGVTWTQQIDSGQRNWSSLTSSSDGTKLAAVNQGGYIYTSTDSGVTWIEQTDSGTRSWYSITSSADGTKLAATVLNGYIYTSTDSGVNWTEQTNSNIRTWRTIASSSDGTKLAATVGSGYIYTSTDSGVNWTEQTNAGSRTWRAVASSSDGTKLVAVVENGYIYTSTDSGVNWTEQTGSGSRDWASIASSSDGTKLAAGSRTAFAGYIYISTDSGVTWVEQTGPGEKNWGLSIASSDDGLKLITAINNPGRIYTYGPVTEADIVTGITSYAYKTYASLTAEITDEGSGGITERGFEYGLDTSYGSTKSNSGVISEGEFSLPATGLTCNTLYHYRAYVINGSVTSTGDDATFTTAACDSTDPITLYAVDGGGGNPAAKRLFKLDPNTGIKVETIGLVGFSATGLAFHPDTGVLYGTVGNNGASQRGLITINTTTGAGTLLGIVKDSDDNSLSMPGIAFRSNGTLYGFSSDDESLFTIDITSCNGVDDLVCLATKVGEGDINSSGGNGLVFDNEDNLYLFADGDNAYFTLDPSTGLMIEEIPFSNSSGEFYNIPAATMGPDDVLYMSIINYGSNPAVLATLDTNTATITRLLENNTDMRYIDPIAFYIAPEEVEEEPQEEESSGSSSGSTRRVTRVEPTLTEPGNPETTPIDCLPTYNYSPSTGMKCPTLSTPTPVCLLTQTLKLWSRGEEVKCLQTKLNITSDGIFGPITRATVINFQTSKNLLPDGIVGPITMGVVNSN